MAAPPAPVPVVKALDHPARARGRCSRFAGTAGLVGLYLFATYWFGFFGMRAEIRTLDYTGTDGLPKHEASTLWMRIECPDWDPAYTGSKQPVPCDVLWFGEPAMVVGVLGWLLVVGGGIAWVGQAFCCACATPLGAPARSSTAAIAFKAEGGAGTDAGADLEHGGLAGCAPPPALGAWHHTLANLVVLAGSLAIALDWVVVASDASRLDTLSGDAWYSALCAPLYVLCLAVKAGVCVRQGCCVMKPPAVHPGADEAAMV